MDKIFEIKSQTMIVISQKDWLDIGEKMGWNKIKGVVIEKNPAQKSYVAELVGHTSGFFADEDGAIHQRIYEPDI